MKKRHRKYNIFKTALLTSPRPGHPQTTLSSVSSVAVSGTTIWAQAPNLASNLLISPLVFLQITFGVWLLLTTSHSHPSRSHTTLDSSEKLTFFCFHSCLPRAIFHTAAKAIFENHKSDQAPPYLKPVTAFHHPVKSQLLTSVPQLYMARSLPVSPVFSYHFTLPLSLPFQGLCTCCPLPGRHLPGCCLACSLDSSLDSNVTASNKVPWPPYQK